GMSCAVSVSDLLLFLVLRPRPPRSPLFPYTTLSDLYRRSRSTDHPRSRSRPRAPRPRKGLASLGVRHQPQRHRYHVPCLLFCHRSEEHTSELQSRENLVCRLLLEKKKIDPGGDDGYR